MDDSTLITIIDRERKAGIGRDDSTASDRDDATAFYEGDAKGKLAAPEIDDRSGVVSKDLMDAVEWVMPSLMRMFAGSDDVIRFEPESSGDEQACKDATEYCSWVLHRKNPGFIVLHDAFKSALITRTGIVKVYPDETWVTREERYEGLDEMSYQALLSDQSVEPVSVEIVADTTVSNIPGMPQGQMPPAYNVTVRRKTKQVEYRVLGIPPEEVTFSKDTRDLDDLRFVCHDVEKTRSDLLSMGYKEADIDECFTDDGQSSAWMYEARYTRGDYDGVYMDGDDPADKSQRKVTLSEAYLKVDYDDDGIAEYRRVVKAGSVVFENDVTDDHPFALFTPILMPYKLIGMSFYDLLEDIQQIKTKITRQMIDSMVIANNPRMAALDNGRVNLDDLLDARPGGVVRMKEIGAVAPLVMQDISGNAQNSIAYFNQVRDSRSGVKEYTQGLIGGELSQSQVGSQGVAMLADAAAARIELIARVFAETGITRIYKLLLKLISQHQDNTAELKINGHWMTVDPRAWKDEYTMTVSVGVGSASQDKKLQRAQLLLQTQQAAYALGLVQPQNALAGLQTLTEALGYRDVGKFFSPPQQGQDKPSPAEIQMQVEREKIQMQMQLEQAKQSAQAQEQAQTKQMEVERDTRDAQNQMALAQFKAQQEMQLAREKAQLDYQQAIEIAKINAQARIAAAQASGVKDDPTAISVEGAIGL